MSNTRWLQSDVAYVRQLVEAGMNGVTAGWNGHRNRNLPPDARNSVWATTVIGGLAAGLSVLLDRRRRSGRGTALGIVVGCITGLGGGVAWSSRGLATDIGRSVLRKVNAVRDEHWLAANPIDYA